MIWPDSAQSLKAGDAANILAEAIRFFGLLRMNLCL
jgi:hypothetical protein